MGDSGSSEAGRVVGQENGGFGNSCVYDTAEFHLYCRKIIACSKRYSHEWTTCPFAHPGEKAKRRDPRTHQYDCEMCPTVAKGEVCEHGAGCPHSHHVFESWLHPQKFRTMICKDGQACHREVCFFAHGAEQLRAPTGGPSQLRRQSCSQEEAARHGGASAAAAVAAGCNSSGGAQNPQAAETCAAVAAVPSHTMPGNGGVSGSNSRHVWVQGPQQQQQQQGAVAIMPFFDVGAAAGSSRGRGRASFSDHPFSSSSNAVHANSDSPCRFSLCESSSNNMMSGHVAGTSGMQSSGNNAYSGSVRSSTDQGRLVLGGNSSPAGGNSTSNNAGLADMSSMHMLVSSLMTEIYNTRQEAIDSRNAAVQAQQQLKVITDALSAASTGPAGAAAAEAGQPLGGTSAAQEQLQLQQQQQQQQQALLQRAAAGMSAVAHAPAPGAAGAAAATGLQRAGPGLTHTTSDGSSMSCSGSWAAAGAMAGLPTANAAAADSGSASLETAVAHRLSYEQAAGAAAAGAPGSSSMYPMLSGAGDGQLRGYAVPSSYPMAAGNAGLNAGDGGAGCSDGVVNWLQLLPPAQGLDAVVPAGDYSTMTTMSDMGASTTGGMATASSWLNSFEAGAPVLGLTPAAASAAVSHGFITGTGNPAAQPSGNGMQQHPSQQQLTSDYLLHLQQQHGLFKAPEPTLIFSGGVLQNNSQQQLQQQQAMRHQHAMQQHQVIRSAPVMLQGWPGSGRIACVDDCINSGSTLERLTNPSVDMPTGCTAPGGSRQLGWL